LLIKRYSQGQAIYMVDMRVLALIRLLLKHEKRAAEELGQWGEKTSPDRGSESRRPDSPGLGFHWTVHWEHLMWRMF